MDIINNKKNKSTIFILPLLYPDTKYIQVLTDNFINCYISENTSLLIEFKDKKITTKIPDKLLNDYKRITKSLYSKLSNISKQQILNFWDENENSYLYSILYKTKKILNYWSRLTSKELYLSKDKEYWPLFNMNKESDNKLVLNF